MLLCAWNGVFKISIKNKIYMSIKIYFSMTLQISVNINRYFCISVISECFLNSSRKFKFLITKRLQGYRMFLISQFELGALILKI